jgi:hypothetical protein
LEKLMSLTLEEEKLYRELAEYINSDPNRLIAFKFACGDLKFGDGSTFLNYSLYQELDRGFIRPYLIELKDKGLIKGCCGTVGPTNPGKKVYKFYFKDDS